MDIRAAIREQLLSKNYYLAKIAYHLWWHGQSLGKQTLVVYQMGRVGSTSIRDSLEALNLDMSIYQVHALSDQGITQMEQMYWGETPKVFRRALLPETKHVFAGHFLRTQLNTSTAPGKWKVVTLVRDPIARNVSEFFYSVDTTKDDPYLPDFYERYRSDTLNATDLIERFLERFHENSAECQLPLRWFDTEFNVALGIDVFSSDFPKSKGYQILREESADVLLVKLEKLDQCYSQAFDEFLGLGEFPLVTANTASQKRYYPAFKSFMDHVHLPASYVSSMYDSRYMTHFYSTEEIRGLWNKWHKQ